MDGRGRLAEPVNDGAARRARRRRRGARARVRRVGTTRSRFERAMRRWLGPGAEPGRCRAASALRPRPPCSCWRALGYGAVRGGHLPVVVAELRDVRDAVANTLGFRITSIALAGQRQLTREEILTIAGVTGRTSLLFLDAADVARRGSRPIPWIAEATVLKLYPGRLHIAITEREAFALWQKDGKVSVIADDGTVLEPFVAAPLRQAAAGRRRRRRHQGQGFPRAARPLSDGPRAGARLGPGRRAALEPQAQERHRRAAAGNRRRARARHAGAARPRQEAPVARHRRDRSAAARSRDRAAFRRRPLRHAQRRSKDKNKTKKKAGDA